MGYKCSRLLLAEVVASVLFILMGITWTSGIVNAQENLYDPGKNGTWQYFFDPGEMFDIGITGDSIWIGTARALYKLNRNTMQITQVIQYPSLGGFPASIVGKSLIVDSNGVVWIAAYKLGVLRFDGTWKLFTTDHGLETTNLTDIIVGADGTIWCSWDNDTNVPYPGISRLNGTVWNTIVGQQFVNTGITHIRAIDFSLEGDLWIASYQGAAKYASNNLVVYNSSPVAQLWDIDAVTSNNVWASRSNGLIHFDGIEWSFYQKNSENLPYNSVHVASDGKVWSIRKGRDVVVWDGSVWTSYGTQQGFSSWNLSRMRFSDENVPWVIASIGADWQSHPSLRGGLHSFEGGSWQRYNIGAFFPGTVNDLHSDASGQNWAITHDGNLHAVKLTKSSWTDIPFSIEPLGRFHKASAVAPTGSVWLSTYHATVCGLTYCSGDSSTFSYDGTQWKDEELLPGTPNRIYPDQQGNVWFDGKGLVRLSGSTIYTYTKENGGLPGNTIGRVAQMGSEVWAYVQDGTGNSAIPYLRKFNGTAWVVVPALANEKGNMNPILVDKQGHAWLSKVSGSSGWVIEVIDGVITDHRASTEPGGYSLLTHDNDSVFVDQYNRLVAIYGKKVSMYDDVNWFYKEFNYADLPLVDKPGNSIRDFILDSDGSYWFGTDDGIAVFTPNNLNETFSVSGKVKSQTGGNLIGTTVLLDGEPFVNTDSNGNFVVYDLMAGQHTIAVQKEGLYFVEQTLNITKSVKGLEFKGQAEPINTQVVVFIPGIAGSQLFRNIQNFPDEQIWPVYPDYLKAKMRMKPGIRDYSIYTDDAIRSYVPLYLRPLTKDVYGPFLETLVQSGYVEYRTNGEPNKRTVSGCDSSQKSATLFVFPWDWRFGAVDAVDSQGSTDLELSLTPNNTALLEQYVLCILQIHPNAEITLVTHSQGWFIGRTYVLQNATNHNIAHHIAIAPPRLGAPKTLAMMLTGDWEPKIISKELAKTLLEHFPGAHQLLPSELYWTMSGSPLNINFDPLLSKGDVSFVDFQDVLQKYYVSPEEDLFYESTVPFVENMKRVYENPSFADLRNDTSSVKYDIIYGVQENRLTIGKVLDKALWTYDNRLLSSDHGNEYNLLVTYGDGTVPEVSASGMGSENLNGQASTHMLLGDAMEHQGMMNETQLQDCVLYLLEKGTVCNEIKASNFRQLTSTRYLKLWGIDTLEVTDGISTTQNLLTSTLTLDVFPDIASNYLGDHSIMLAITGDKTYTISFTSQGEYFESENLYSTGDTNLRLIRFLSQPATGQQLALITSQNILARLQIDGDADGKVDTEIQPVADLKGEQANDVIPPSVQINYDSHGMLEVTATDNSSGVSRIMFSTDRSHFMHYTNSVLLTDPSIVSVTATAEDKAGNVSPFVSKSITVVTSNSVYLPLINR